jgi:hypothetical protein
MNKIRMVRLEDKAHFNTKKKNGAKRKKKKKK